MKHLSRRELLLGASLLVLSRNAEAGINNPGTASVAPPPVTTPTGRVVLNINEPTYYNNYFPWIDLYKNSESDLEFYNAGSTQIFRTGGASPGGSNFGIPSAFGVCCDNNGEPIDMSVTAPTVVRFVKLIYLQSGAGAILPPTLSGVSYTFMFTGGIGWTATVNGTLTGAVSFTATGASSSFTFNMPNALPCNVFMELAINTGSLASPPKKIHIIPTAFVATFDPTNAATMISPDYINFLKSTAGILRAMPIQSTNVNYTTTGIASIPPIASMDWSFGTSGIYQGCPLAVLAQLALQSNKHLWFNVPALFIGPKTSQFNNTQTNPLDPALGAFTAANPCVYQPANNQPFVNGDTVLPWLLNVNFQGGAWCRNVKCQGISSSVLSLSGHNFVNGQLIRLGCDVNGGGDTSTYPAGVSKATYYYVCNVVAGVSFQIAQIATPSTPITLTGAMKGPVNQLGAITGGTGGTPGTYTNVPMTGGTGATCTATVVVGAGGNVTSVIPNYTVIGTRLSSGSGTGYTIGDTLSALSANIGGVTGFSVLVGCVDINVQQSLGNGNSFTVASAATKSLQFSGPGSDTSFYGSGLASPSINVGASTFTTTGQIVNGSQVALGTLDGVFTDQTTYPTGITKGQIYFVVNLAGSTFQLSATRGGSPITLSGTPVGAFNFYAVINATSGIVSSPFNLSYFQSQIDAVAQFFKTAFAGTGIRVYYELGNEIWGGSSPGTAVGNVQALGLGLGAGQGFIANGYMQAAMADQLFTSYGGDKTKYRMHFVGGGIASSLLSAPATVITGINAYLTAVSSSKTIAQLFDHVIYTNYYGWSYGPNGSSVTATFTNGSPGTVVVGAGAGPATGMPFKFHATAGSLPAGLSENTTYWLAGTAPNFNVTATPGGSNINLSGTLGTYTCYYCRGDVVNELIQQSIALNISLPGTWPTKYDFFAQAMRDDQLAGKWTYLSGGGTGPNYGISFLTSALASFASTFLGVGQPLHGLTVMPYEGGDNNNNNLGWWPETQTGQQSNVIGAALVGTISNGVGGSGTLLTVSSGTVQIGMDLPSSISITASASGTTTMTVTNAPLAFLGPGMTISGPGVTGTPTIISQLTGTTGQAGTYQLSSSQTFTNAALTVSTGASAGTMITGIRNDLGPGNYTVNISQQSSPITWLSTTERDFYATNMFHNTYAQVFVDEYNANGAAMSGFISQFLDANSVSFGDGNGTYGMIQYIGQSNPRLTWVQFVNNLP